MKRTIRIILIAVAALVAIGYASLFMLTTQSELAAERTDSIVASIPLLSAEPITVQTSEGVTFKLDTGSDLSCITAADLALLRSRGVKVWEHRIPVAGRSFDGHLHASDRRVVIDLPLEYVEAQTDSAGVVRHIRNAARDNVLAGAEFLLVTDSGSMSCLGIDFLGKFTVEYLYNGGLLRFHTSRPEGYQDFADLHTSYWPSHTPWPGRRYYIDLSVDHVNNRYFIDTGLRRAALKLPASRAEQSMRRLSDDSLISSLGTFDAQTDNVWVECGNRAGSQIAFYCDNEEEPYSINPFNFFTQDLLIDFANFRIALHPFVSLPKRHFNMSDSAAETTPER